MLLVFDVMRELFDFGKGDLRAPVRKTHEPRLDGAVGPFQRGDSCAESKTFECFCQASLSQFSINSKTAPDSLQGNTYDEIRLL
jgi:hypothetical protein